MLRLFYIMSTLNPLLVAEDYIQGYQDTVPYGASDVQKGLAANLQMMNAQWNYDNAWYDAHESSAAKYNEYRDLGVNPLSAMRAILGFQSSGSNNPANTVSQSGGNSMLDSIMSAFGTGVNSINKSIQTDLQAGATAATIDNLDSQTAMNNANLPYIPQRNEADIKEAQAHAEEMLSQSGLNDADKALIMKNVEGFEEYRQADLDIMRQKYANLQEENKLIIQEVATSKASEENLDAQSILYGEQAETERKEQSNIEADTANKVALKTNIEKEGAILEEERKQAKLGTQEARWSYNNLTQLGIKVPKDIGERWAYYMNQAEKNPSKAAEWIKKADDLMYTTFDFSYYNSSGEAGGRPVGMKIYGKDFGPTHGITLPGRTPYHRTYYNPN